MSSLEDFISQNGWKKLLDIMVEEGKRRNAPVLTLKEYLTEPFQHLVFAILSARTRDEQTVKAAKRLIEVADTPEKLASLPVEEIEKLISNAGFYRNKAKNLKAMAEILVKNHSSKVPDDFNQLTELPGVGRKTANVVLSYAFNKNTIAVDTHVHRISNRLGFVKTKYPIETERELERIVPVKYWRRLNRAMVAFGQTVCKPLKPLCQECPLGVFCPKIGV
jgi:endonuclease-3